MDFRDRLSNRFSIGCCVLSSSFIQPPSICFRIWQPRFGSCSPPPEKTANRSSGRSDSTATVTMPGWSIRELFFTRCRHACLPHPLPQSLNPLSRTTRRRHCPRWARSSITTSRAGSLPALFESGKSYDKQTPGWTKAGDFQRDTLDYWMATASMAPEEQELRPARPTRTGSPAMSAYRTPSLETRQPRLNCPAPAHF